MSIAVGVTTSPRKRRTLDYCLLSLEWAGFENPVIFADGDVEVPAGHETIRRPYPLGAWGNWIQGLRELLGRGKEVCVMVQDDAVFARNVVQYIEASGGWPATAFSLYCPSIYCPSIYSSKSAGWIDVNAGSGMRGAVALGFSSKAAAAFLFSSEALSHKKRIHIDSVVGKWCESAGIPISFHWPSLAQHIGRTSTIYPKKGLGRKRRADSFVGTATDCLDLLTF